jgi:hypothetical protein
METSSLTYPMNHPMSNSPLAHDKTIASLGLNTYDERLDDDGNVYDLFAASLLSSSHDQLEASISTAMNPASSYLYDSRAPLKTFEEDEQDDSRLSFEVKAAVANEAESLIVTTHTTIAEVGSVDTQTPSESSTEATNTAIAEATAAPAPLVTKNPRGRPPKRKNNPIVLSTFEVLPPRSSKLALRRAQSDSAAIETHPSSASSGSKASNKKHEDTSKSMLTHESILQPWQANHLQSFFQGDLDPPAASSSSSAASKTGDPARHRSGHLQHHPSSASLMSMPLYTASFEDFNMSLDDYEVPGQPSHSLNLSFDTTTVSGRLSCAP